MNSSKNKLNSEIIYNFNYNPNTHNSIQFLEKFYWELKKLFKLFQFPINLFTKIIYYCMPLMHTLVKSFIYIYIYKVVISKRSKTVRRNKPVPKYFILIDKQTKRVLKWYS